MSTKLSSNTINSITGIEKEKLRLQALERGRRLRLLRNMTGMVTQPFSELCGVGRTTIRAWEQGISPLTEKGARNTSVQEELPPDPQAPTPRWNNME